MFSWLQKISNSFISCSHSFLIPSMKPLRWQMNWQKDCKVVNPVPARYISQSVSCTHVLLICDLSNDAQRAIYYIAPLLLLGGELLAERCRTDDLMPSISVLCLPLCRVNPEILWLYGKSSPIILSQVVLGRPAGLLQSDGGRSADGLELPQPGQLTIGEELLGYHNNNNVVRQRRWHDGGLPRDSTGPGARRTWTGRTGTHFQLAW